MNKPLCIFHANCADGFGAAWAVWRRFPGWEFHAGVYQTEPPDVTGRDVVMVDFSYKAPVMEALKRSARSILVLDHHKSAEEDLATVADMMNDGPFPFDQWDDYVSGRMDPPVDAGNLCCWFDMEQSGAGLTWKYFHPIDKRPALINHIEDRDLWRFQLEGTRQIQAALFSYPYDFELWDELIHEFEADVQGTGPGYTQLAMDGEAIERKHNKDVRELVEVTRRELEIAGVRVPVASLPYTLTSDAGHLMAADAPFAACYWDTPESRVFSLRSRDDGFDVSEVAKKYGGGGHRNAAGFAVPRDHPLAQA